MGDRLRLSRNRAKLSLGQVAEYEAVSVTYLSALERGANKPNVWDLLARLAQRYRVSSDYLLGLSEDPTPPDERRPMLLHEQEIIDLIPQLSDERRAELLDHMRVALHAQQRADNYREMAIYVERLNEVAGTDAMNVLRQMLDAVAAGNAAAALLALDAYFGRTSSGANIAQEEARQGEK